MKEDHIIEKVVLEVNTTSEKKANQLKNNISLFLQSELFPAMEELLDKYDNHEHIVRFDKLDVSFKIDEWKNSEEIKNELLKRLEQQISSVNILNQNSVIPHRRPFFLSKQQLEQEDHIKDEPESKLKTESNEHIIEFQQNYRNTLLFFLENGYLPWFGREEYINKIINPEDWEINLRQKTFLKALKMLIKTNDIAIERMVLQFSDESVMKFVEVCEVLTVKRKRFLLDFVEGLSSVNRKQFLTSLIKISVSPQWQKSVFSVVGPILFEVKKSIHDIRSESTLENKVAARIQEYFTKDSYDKYFQISKLDFESMVLDDNSYELDENTKRGQAIGVETNLEDSPTIISQELVNSKKEKEPPFFETGNSNIFVQNAGLVLFYPFLNTFFKSFNWLNENGKIRKENVLQAVQALHYCASGVESFFEPELILEKYLCGLPLNSPIPKRSMLKEEIREEANNMIEQVIRNWPALKNTSPDGLRQMFVQRDGKLIQIDSGFKLIVERKAQDILLDKLQWNISIVKLPWKDELLFVEWN